MGKIKTATSTWFECNLPLPQEIPQFYHWDMMQKLMTTVERVYDRTDKLNRGLDLCTGMKPETYQRLAKKVFDISNASFDAMTPEDLAKMCRMLYDGTEATSREEWPNAIVLYDTWFVTVKDWEALRHFGIGGSESSIIMGENHYQTKQGLFYDKLGYPDKQIDYTKNAIFERGHFLEDNVVDTFCRLTGSTRVNETRMFASKRYPHSTANIDAIIRTASNKLAVFEAKSAMAEKKGDWMGSKIPPNYITQMHQYSGVLNDDRIDGVYIGMIPVADIAVDGTYIGSAYSSKEYFHHYIPRDEAAKQFEIEVLSAEEEFWQNHIAVNVDPGPSGDAEMDKKVHLSFEPNPITDPVAEPVEANYTDYEELLDSLRQSEKAYTEKKRELERMEADRDNLRNEVLNILGSSTVGVFRDQDGNPEITIKNSPITKTTVDAKLLKLLANGGPVNLAGTGLEDVDPKILMEVAKSLYQSCIKESTYSRFSVKVG